MTGDHAATDILDTLDSDISDRPGLLRPIPAELVERARDLIHDVEVDLEESLMVDRRESRSSLLGWRPANSVRSDGPGMLSSKTPNVLSERAE